MNFSNYDDNDELHNFEKTFVPLMAELELEKKTGLPQLTRIST